MLAKKIFGHDHEIMYDTIINHDVYDMLRISLEIPRGQNIETDATLDTIVVLNGKEIGKVTVHREFFIKNGRTRFNTLGYTAFRKYDDAFVPHRHGKQFADLKVAVAAIITDYVE